MKNWFNRLLQGKESGVSPIPEKPTGAPYSVSDSVAHRRRGNDLLDRGNLQSAIACYQKAVASDPDSADAHTSLGFALKEVGELVSAQTEFQRAVELQPDSFDSLYLLGQTCMELRLHERAAISFEKALTLQPEFESLYGELCQALFEIRSMDKARDIILSGIQRYPDNASFPFFLGNLYAFMEEWQSATTAYTSALRLNPNLTQAHANLASGFKAQSDMAAAMQHAECALKLDPSSPDAHACMAANQEALGSFKLALASYETALDLDAAHAASHRGKGNVLLKLGMFLDGIQSLEKALIFEPDSAETYRDLGFVYLELGRYREAEEYSRKALSFRPLYPSVQNNLGNALMALGKLIEAEEYYETALSIDPDSDVYYSNLGSCMLQQGRLVQAIARFQRAIELNPDSMTARGNLLYALSVDPTAPNGQYLIEALVFGKRLTALAGLPYDDWPVCHDGRVSAPLRIGLVSGNLRENPVGFFLESVLSHIDPARLQLVAYSCSARDDALTQRIRPFFAQWESLLGLDDDSAARKIRSDRINILLDLNGHTEGNRLPVFVRKPAPIQVSWLGYWGSTGVPAIDYILADEVGLPPSDERYFTETVYYLPQTRLCFTAPESALPVSPLPAARNGFVTFGCFQTRTKVNDQVLSLWGQIMQAVPNARLKLASNQVDDAASLRLFQRRLRDAGIDPDRVAVAGPVSREKYLANYALVDIILDTFPFTGGTTTCEALWMGVPTLTLSGDTLIARQGAGMLSCVGLDNWVARDEADYVAKAISHAKDIAGLADLRTGLRARALASPLFDAPKFARNLEKAFSAMWQQKMNPVRESLPVPGASQIDSPSNF